MRNDRLYKLLVFNTHVCYILLIFFFFNDTATTEIYTLSLHDALPIYLSAKAFIQPLDAQPGDEPALLLDPDHHRDRKSTRLNSSHQIISYAVFCLKKKTRAAACHPMAQIVKAHI